MPHPAVTPDAVAVVTGGASGIGLAAATRFAQAGLRVCIADLGAERLAGAAAAIAAAAPAADAVLTMEADVGKAEDIERLQTAVTEPRRAGILMSTPASGRTPASSGRPTPGRGS